VGDTTGIRIDNGPYILPATPPPDIDLDLWDQSFAAILARRPARLFLTHYGYAENPAAHIAEFRERLYRWCEVAETVITSATKVYEAGHSANPNSIPSDSAAREAAARQAIAAQDAEAMQQFIKKSRAEMDENLGPVEAEHHAFTAALHLSYLGLARYIRKRNSPSSTKEYAAK
jgi:hypothetical protein